MSLPARLSLVTLGVTDIARSTAFYEALGWPLSPASVEGEVSFFDTAGGLLALWRREALAADAGQDPESADGFRAVALAINLDSREQVDAAFAELRRIGASLSRRRRQPTGTDTWATSPTPIATCGR